MQVVENSLECRDQLTLCTPSYHKERQCQSCSGVIPAARIKAQPNAVECVPCLEGRGDVPLLRRFDEVTRDGELSSTVFVSNSYVESAMTRGNNVLAPEAAFDIAVGDDSALVRERGAGIGVDVRELIPDPYFCIHLRDSKGLFIGEDTETTETNEEN